VGVRIPVFAPHWARNHDNISVAVAVVFRLRSVSNQAKIYRVNRMLRKMGAGPAPPGVSPWRDRLRLAAADAYYAIPQALADFACVSPPGQQSLQRYDSHSNRPADRASFE
jgi:hypothetical protein